MSNFCRHARLILTETVESHVNNYLTAGWSDLETFRRNDNLQITKGLGIEKYSLTVRRGTDKLAM